MNRSAHRLSVSALRSIHLSRGPKTIHSDIAFSAHTPLVCFMVFHQPPLRTDFYGSSAISASKVKLESLNSFVHSQGPTSRAILPVRFAYLSTRVSLST